MKQRVTKNLKDFLDLRYIGEHYPLSRRKTQQLVYEGRLPAFKLDRKIYVKRVDLEKLLTATPVVVDLDRLVNETAGEILGR